MSLQERTLVVRNFDPDKTTNKLLKELCLQGGPVRKVILRSDHAFVEFDDVPSVGYTKALLDGIKLFGRPLSMEPKLRIKNHNYYSQRLNDYIAYDKYNRSIERQRRQMQEQELRQQQQQQQQMQMQMQTQMQYQQQQQTQFVQVQPQQVPLPFPHLAHPTQVQYQAPPVQILPHLQPGAQLNYRHPQRPPDFRGPQFRNYR